MIDTSNAPLCKCDCNCHVKYNRAKHCWNEYIHGHNQIKKLRDNPDFLVKGQKKVIEFNGTYWHKEDYPDKIWIQAWKDIGYDLLIIHEHDIKEDIESVLNRIADFVGYQSWQMSLNI